MLILLDSVEILKGIGNFLAFMLFMVIFYGGFVFISQKYFGIRYRGKGSNEYQKALRTENFISDELYKFNERRPDIVEKAKESCRRNCYTLTTSNILTEARKIENKELNIPTFTEKLYSKIKSFDISNGDKSLSKLQKLEKLNELYKTKALNEEEYNRLKKEIID